MKRSALLFAGLVGTLAGGLLGFGLFQVLSDTDLRRPAPPALESGASEIQALERRLEEGREAWRVERLALREEVANLTGELERVTEERVRREQEWLQYTQSLTSLVPKSAPREIIEALGGQVPAPDPEPEPPPPDPFAEARRERAEEIGRALTNLFRVERIDSLIPLETGALGEGWVGPVVLRMIDVRGRPVGSLSADRLRLEGSRAGRSLTIVLEAGYERRDGRKVPFENTPPGADRGGERRIFIQQTDPAPWLERCPELFTPESLEPLADDGLWHVFLVHRRLNQLLEQNSELGYWRLSALGGIVGGVLRGVELENLDRSGRLVRRILADRLTISSEDRGMLLLLEDGIQLKGLQKDPFLDGRYRIFLPGAQPEKWLEAGLPGLVDPTESSAGSHAAPGGSRR